MGLKIGILNFYLWQKGRKGLREVIVFFYFILYFFRQPKNPLRFVGIFSYYYYYIVVVVFKTFFFSLKRNRVRFP